MTETLVQTTDRALYDEVKDLKVGMRIRMIGKDERVQMITVREIHDDTVVADANHPLAGQVLHFQIAIVTVREPTEAELAQGFAASVSGAATGESMR